MEKYPIKSIEVAIDQISIRNGQVITVFLFDKDASMNDESKLRFGEPSHIQVELRVLPDGKREIFISDLNKVEIKPFSQWTPID